MSDAPLTNTTSLRAGDVVQIGVRMTDKQTGESYWWRRFACVVRVTGGWRFDALTLKLRPDFSTDLRRVDFLSPGDRPQVITRLPEDRWPQGVVAMRMKAIALGWVKLGDDPPGPSNPV